MIASTAVEIPRAPEARPVFVPVKTETVVQALHALGGGNHASARFPEIGRAIALAANEKPIRPEHPEGANLTAAVLLGIAFVCSRLSPTSSAGGAYGLFHLRPLGGCEVSDLTLPRTGALVAAQMVRRSLYLSQSLPFVARLVPYFAMNMPHASRDKHLDRSARVVGHATGVLERFFSRQPRQVHPERRASETLGKLLTSG